MPLVPMSTVGAQWETPLVASAVVLLVVRLVVVRRSSSDQRVR